MGNPRRIIDILLPLAFVGNITHVGTQLGTAFFVFALVLFPSLFFLGLVTFDSVLQSAIEDAICVRGISRIRHLYVELAPQMRDYFILPTHDAAGSFRRARWWQSSMPIKTLPLVTLFSSEWEGMKLERIGTVRHGTIEQTELLFCGNSPYLTTTSSQNPLRMEIYTSVARL